MGSNNRWIVFTWFGDGKEGGHAWKEGKNIDDDIVLGKSG